MDGSRVACVRAWARDRGGGCISLARAFVFVFVFVFVRLCVLFSY